MAVPTRLGYKSEIGTGTAAITISLTDIPDGAWMVAFYLSGATYNFSPVVPSGWRNFMDQSATEGGQRTGTRRTGLIGKIKQPGDTSLSWAVAASASRRLIVMWGEGSAPVEDWLRGTVGVRAVSDEVAGQSVDAGTNFTSVAPGVSVADAGSLVLSLMMEATTATGTFDFSSGGATKWFDYPEATGNIEWGLVGYTTPSPGLTPDVVATASASQSSNGLGVQLVIPPAEEVLGPAFGLSMETSDGAVAVSYLDDEGVRLKPKSVRLLMPGFSSVAQMLETPGATWAHRGGSAPYPEMSEWAYDQSVLRGYGALEFSAQRTSDGVWFGLHDNSLAYTTQNAALTAAISTMTWAQVQEYMITRNAGSIPRPFYRLEDFLEKYGSTHVLILDPKNGLSQYAEFFSIIEGIVDPERVVFKYYGVLSTTYTNAAKAKGFSTWGYFYQDNYDNGTLATNAARWDMIGMAYNATTAWSASDGVLSHDRPVVAHIIPNQDAYDLAISKGASMVQTAGVHVVSPVSWYHKRLNVFADTYSSKF